jgi:hypothetical protein
MNFFEAGTEREIASNTTNDYFESKEKKLRERSQAMKKQEAVRQEFRRGAEVVRSLSARMQRIEEKGRQSAVEPSSQETKQRETRVPELAAHKNNCHL